MPILYRGGIYQQEFIPPVKPFENVGVYTGGKKWRYYEIFFVEGLPHGEDMVKDFGSIASGASSEETKLDTELDMDDNEIALLRFYPLDNILCELKLPRGVSRFKLKNKTLRVSPLTPIYDPSLKSTEFAVYEDERPYMIASNTSGYDLDTTRVQFFGWRLVGNELDSVPDRFTVLFASGYGAVPITKPS